MNGNIQKQQAMDEETRAHQEISSSIRFKQNMVHGIGAATVFGLVAAGGSALLKLAAFTGAAGIAATVGIAVLAVIGVGCLYLSSKYTAELVRIEQNRQAIQIAKGITAATPAVEQKPVLFQSQSKATGVSESLDGAVLPAESVPQVTVQQPQLQDKVVPITLANARMA